MVIDLDDTTAEFAPACIRFNNMLYGGNFRIEEYQEDWQNNLWQISKQESMDWGTKAKYEVYSNLNMINGAKLAWEILSQQYRLVVATSRVVAVRDVTEKWLQDNDVYDLVYDLHFLGDEDETGGWDHRMTKADFVKKCGAVGLIDDQTKHIFPTARLGVQSILFSHYDWMPDVIFPKDLQNYTVQVRSWSKVVSFLCR